MMSFYNMMFSANPASDLLLATLKLTRGDCGRFRNVFVADGKIAVYTRNGGGNREDYMPDFSEHPNYLYDEDDDFDCTYATIYFSFPAEYAEGLAKIQDKEPFDPNQRWVDLFDSLGINSKPDNSTKVVGD